MGNKILLLLYVLIDKMREILNPPGWDESNYVYWFLGAERVGLCNSGVLSSVFLPTFLPTYLPAYPSVHLSIYSFIHPFIYPSIHLSIHSFIHLSMYPSIPLSICSCIHLFIYLSAYTLTSVLTSLPILCAGHLQRD